MYWTDYIEDVVYRANLTTGEDRVAIVTEHLPEPGIQTVERPHFRSVFKEAFLMY